MMFHAESEWWLPEGEEHLQKYLTTRNQRVGDRLVYQQNKLLEAMKWVVGPRRTAVDVGAHVGLWSWTLARQFSWVIAFEPVKEHRDCWLLNMRDVPNADLVDVALGDSDRAVRLSRMPGASMRVSVDKSGEPASMRRLDSFNLKDIDFLKIDVEGYEYFVCKGGEETLLRCKPTIIVEQKPATGMVEKYGISETAAVEYLESLGAKRRVDNMNGDYVLSWDK